MNILILNWRDPFIPFAGGAEKVTQKYANYWSSRGHKVFWLTNQYPGAEKENEVCGVTYIRISPKLSVKALPNLVLYPLFLLNSIRRSLKIIKTEKIDVVIDEIHGLPFFSPLYCPKRNVLLVCEFAGQIWDKMYSFPINKIGKFLEKVVYLYIYTNSEIWTISQNTKNDLLKINTKLKTKILPLGIDSEKKIIQDSLKETKHDYPSAVFLARLVKMKGIESALSASKEISKTFNNFKLYVIGRGSKEYEEYLKNFVKQKHLEKNVNFLGYLSEEEKYHVLAKCHFLIHTSYKEGFGLTVLEAGLVGTPAIARTGSSLDEIVENGVDGFVIKDEKEIAEKFIASFNNKSFNTLSENARTKALKYDWKKTFQRSFEVTGL